MRKPGWIPVAAVAIFCLLPVCVHADMGPKRSIEIELQNMPAEPYYFGILEPGTKSGFTDERYENVEEDDRWIGDLFYEYDEDGYRLFLYGGGASSIRYSETQIREYGFLRYSYMVPRTFKVMTVTKSGMVAVSDPLTVKAFNAVCIYDGAANSLVEGTAALSAPFFIESLICLLITLFVEGLILLFFGLFRIKNLPHFLLVNLVTQVLLFAFNLISVWSLSVYAHYIPLWFFAEAVITVFEVLWYRERLVKKDGSISKARNILYGLIANLVSMFIDLPLLIFMVLMR
ncbi:MAG: hypothetical protein J5518_08035 [Lachnospiraceae bacterium]|nr:hypothetical protein [Lachnospiraceae bacterium]